MIELIITAVIMLVLYNLSEQSFAAPRESKRVRKKKRDSTWTEATWQENLSTERSDSDVAEDILFYSLTEVVNSKINILQRKYVTSVYKDEYGIECFESWYGELNYFCNRVLTPKYWELANENPIIEFSIPVEEAMRIMAEKITNHFSSQSLEVERFDIPNDPWEFEKYCADLLTSAGWEASPTKGSGDQGADVIAVLNGRTLVLQCKLYQSAVGNKAVQEIHAAKAHYRATDAAVVATNGYTKSARQLAASTGVLLLHPDDLKYLQ